MPPAISSINRQIEQLPGKPDLNPTPIRIMDGIIIEQAIEQSNDEEIASESDGELSIAERRNVVSLIRGLEDASVAPWKPFGWLRSRLGI